MEMNINLNLKIGEGESQKEITLNYDEAKELYVKLQELFNKTITWGFDKYPFKKDDTILPYITWWSTYIQK